MALGLIGTAMAGAAEGAGRSAAPLAKFTADAELQARAEAAQEKRDQRLSELRKGEADYAEGLRRAGRQSDIDQDTDPGNVAKKGAAAAGLIEAQIPAKVAEKKALGEVDTQQKVDEFMRMAPLQREEAVKTALARLEALSTPEALAAARKIKLAEHIVDPQYTMIPNADGTVDAVNVRNPGAGVVKLKGADGEPIIRKDPEELKAATSIINMANGNLRIAEAAYKAGKDDPDPVVKAQAEETWRQAQAEARRLTAPAYAVLYGKSGAKGIDPGPAAPSSPYAEGTEVRNKADGKVYVVRNGVPVLKDAGKETRSRSSELVSEPPGATPAARPEGLIARRRREVEEEKSRDDARKREYGDAAY